MPSRNPRRDKSVLDIFLLPARENRLGPRDNMPGGSFLKAHFYLSGLPVIAAYAVFFIIAYKIIPAFLHDGFKLFADEQFHRDKKICRAEIVFHPSCQRG